MEFCKAPCAAEGEVTEIVVEVVLQPKSLGRFVPTGRGDDGEVVAWKVELLGPAAQCADVYRAEPSIGVDSADDV